MHLGLLSRISDRKRCTGQDGECKIVVISKDTGFDHIIRILEGRKKKNFRNEKISGKQVQTKKQVKKQTSKEKDGQMTKNNTVRKQKNS